MLHLRMMQLVKTAVVGFLLLALAVLAGSCDQEPAQTSPSWDDAHIEPQGLIELGPIRRPNARVDLDHARAFHSPLDSDSVEIVDFGGKRFYQPVELCHRGFEYLNAYRETGDRDFLRRAQKVAAALSSIAIFDNRTAFCQYLFPYALHKTIRFSPPWFSGMAQGEWVGLLTRLFEATADSSYLDLATKAFASLLRLGPQSEPWVARIDSAGFYWIEEFPASYPPGMTLNGFIAAVFGVYDYFWVTGDERARQVYEASLTTIKHYLSEFRRPGELSYYCLGHKSAANESYHALHISMMYHLYRMSGDEFFREMGDSLAADQAALAAGPMPQNR